MVSSGITRIPRYRYRYIYIYIAIDTYIVVGVDVPYIGQSCCLTITNDRWGYSMPGIPTIVSTKIFRRILRKIHGVDTSYNFKIISIPSHPRG